MYLEEKWWRKENVDFLHYFEEKVCKGTPLNNRKNNNSGLKNDLIWRFYTFHLSIVQIMTNISG